MRGVRFGDDKQSGGTLVEPVHDAGPLDPADARQARPTMADQRVDQRAGRMARRRMDDEPGRLIDHDQMLVLINHGKLDVLADEGRFLRRRRLEGDPCARREPHRRIARNVFVDPHLAGLDQRLEPGARQSETSRGRRLAQEPIEPLAGVLCANVEDLQTFGRNQREAGRRIDPDVFQLGRTALGCRRLQARRLAFAFTSAPAGAADRRRSPPLAARRGDRAPRRSPPHRAARRWRGRRGRAA